MSRASGRSILVDWSANAGDLRIQIALALFRLARKARTSPRVPTALGRIVAFVYLLVVEWTWGIEIPWSTSVGPGLRIYHGTGLVINGDSILGSGVILRQNVCIGARADGEGSPVVEDGASLGAGAIVLGAVRIGAGAQVGAGAVVLGDVPAGAVAVGNPARTI